MLERLSEKYYPLFVCAHIENCGAVFGDVGNKPMPTRFRSTGLAEKPPANTSPVQLQSLQTLEHRHMSQIDYFLRTKGENRDRPPDPSHALPPCEFPGTPGAGNWVAENHRCRKTSFREELF